MSVATNPIVIRGLQKSFGAQMVLNRIDLTIDRGKTLAVLGQSGTGKSVLLKIIIGLILPDSGSIEIEGQDIATVPRDRLNEIRKKIGFLFQNAALYDSLTVAENVDFPLARNTQLSREQRAQRVRELLSKVGMEGAADKLPSEISGGMQKRVGLARALALNPEIVLFDEPTAGLDPITADEIDGLIAGLQKERSMTSVVVTHDIHGVRFYSDRVVMLREGTIVMDGTFANFEKSKDEFLARFLKTAA
ncbi:MAG: ATP-binding cassette domain-containing protein [Bryobacteraceae bacterium]|jgi:phospholipid/cholesterol/gamma-HCH transport system ATP-binding protein